MGKWVSKDLPSQETVIGWEKWMDFQLLCLPTLTLGSAFLFFLQFPSDIGQLNARHCSTTYRYLSVQPHCKGCALCSIYSPKMQRMLHISSSACSKRASCWSQQTWSSSAQMRESWALERAFCCSHSWWSWVLLQLLCASAQEWDCGRFLPSQAILGTPETHGQRWPQSFQLGVGGAFWKGVFQLCEKSSFS